MNDLQNPNGDIARIMHFITETAAQKNASYMLNDVKRKDASILLNFLLKEAREVAVTHLEKSIGIKPDRIRKARMLLLRLDLTAEDKQVRQRGQHGKLPTVIKLRAKNIRIDFTGREAATPVRPEPMKIKVRDDKFEKPIPPRSLLAADARVLTVEQQARLKEIVRNLKSEVTAQDLLKKLGLAPNEFITNLLLLYIRKISVIQEDQNKRKEEWLIKPLNQGL